MAERVRIQKALSNAGVMSRRQAENAIIAGRVAVDGVGAVLGDRIDVSTQVLTIDGLRVPLDPDVETYLLNKPVGVMSTARDPQGRTTVVDLIDSEKTLYPVGRLDLDSEGLILVSNDGSLANLVTHPRFGITKTYLAEVAGQVSQRTVRRLVAGIELEDGPARALAGRLVERTGDRSLVELVMGEGRNREVRRLMESVGHPVLRLARTAIGPLSDPNLAPGVARLLTPAEVRALMEAAEDR